MRIHHLNCGSMTTPGGRIVCHVLLCETANGLVLVDAGFGLDDVRDPKRRLGLSAKLLGAKLDESETAIRQVEALGYQPGDVRDIVITHFDLDHVGGLSDFPDARVHVAHRMGRSTKPIASRADTLPPVAIQAPPANTHLRRRRRKVAWIARRPASRRAG